MLGKEPKGTEDFEDDRELTLNDIIVSMYTADENLPMKADVNRVAELSAFVTLTEFLKRKRLFKGLAILLDTHYRTFLKLSVSNKRMGRTEFVRVASSLMDKETIRMTIGERLTSNLAK